MSGRPSGTCEGMPCYTSGDIAAINAELANAIAEKNDAQASVDDAYATYQVAQQDYMAKDMAVMDLSMELSMATSNTCP